MSDYIATIGIECHVQLSTKTKLFAGVANDAREAAPNTLVSHICFGLPGALPVLNEKVVEYASRMAFAFGTRPQTYSYFERKHYFYPDLPKGYQITQLQKPIIVGGEVEISVNGQKQTVRLNRVQIEEDAGKNTHPDKADYSLVDLNRAGTPLLEIVSEPDITSPEAAKAYAKELYLLARYAGISDADMYHGNMRFDLNVSVSNDPNVLGTRTETKNLNSFRSIEKAAEYEIKRQTELLKKGEKIVQETRGWDEAKQKTVSQRSKEEAHDYRYMPDPDLPPIVLDEAFITRVEKAMPTMPSQWRAHLLQLGLDEAQVSTLLDAELEHEGITYLMLIKDALSQAEYAKFIANFAVNTEIPLRRDAETEPAIQPSDRAALYSGVYALIQAGKLSSTNAKALFTAILQAASLPSDFEAYAKDKGLVQMSDEGALDKIVAEVLAENEAAAQDVKNGEMKAIGFLVGQVMKKSAGQANPGVATQLIKKQLGV
ncbi:MAG: Asp-tRNA(Asn)/Glu-tRNA(Gln) amidotransferase subunit GatB [Candidatus Saccharibacteria bacterium]|nr:Asp-tRNA(Asn)/Glu-tRNA(Gln) amidotransferase subunit GatB [Candidatus Saccharibacteria bacterium]